MPCSAGVDSGHFSLGHRWAAAGPVQQTTIQQKKVAIRHGRITVSAGEDWSRIFLSGKFFRPVGEMPVQTSPDANIGILNGESRELPGRAVEFADFGSLPRGVSCTTTGLPEPGRIVSHRTLPASLRAGVHPFWICIVKNIDKFHYGAMMSG